MIALGKALFNDPALSANGKQSCAACHAPQTGFTGPDELVNAGGAVYQGALPSRFGSRKPPSSACAGESPELFYDSEDGGWFGGMFPPPEVDQNRAELGMFPRPQVDNIVAFLKTLSDGYFQR